MKMKQKIHVAIGSKNPCKIDSVKSAFHKVFQNLNNSNANNATDNEDDNRIIYELVFSCHNVPSKVNDQPMGDDETLLGAKNRAIGSLESAKKLHLDNDDYDIDYGPPHFGVGLEGGIEIKDSHDKQTKELWCMAWMAIVGADTAICTLCKHGSSTFQTTTTSTTTESTTSTSNTRAQNNINSNGSDNGNANLKWSTSKTASFLLPPKVSNLILNHNYELGHADDQVFNRVNSKQGSGTVGVLTKGLITRSDYYHHALVLALVGFMWPEHYLE